MSALNTQQTGGATLLIVDDEPSIREDLRGVFEGAGHRTIAVGDAPAALRLLRKQTCDLVMLDVELPEISGRELCRFLRAQPAMQPLPVVVFYVNHTESTVLVVLSEVVDVYAVNSS